MSGDYPQYIEHDKVVPPQLLMAYNPMKTSSVYHQQKHTKTNKNYKWIYIYITNKNHRYWSYLHQLSDLAHWGTTLMLLRTSNHIPYSA